MSFPNTTSEFKKKDKDNEEREEGAERERNRAREDLASKHTAKNF